MKNSLVSIIVAVVVIAAVIFFGQGEKPQEVTESGVSRNVEIIDGKQVITINAKAGYTPRQTIAKADQATVISMVTNNSFDCSTSLVIPSLKYRKNLPQSGITEILIPAQKQGTVLRGLCSMGMYNFEIRFN